MPISTLRNRILSAAAAAILLLAPGCSRSESPANEPAVAVQTAAARRAPIRRFVQVQGILYAVDQAAVTPKISAPIQAFYVDRGAHVKRGQLLALLESRDLAAAAAEARGNREQAEANYRSVLAVSLPEEIARSQSEVQSTTEALDAAQKLYESRKALLDQGALPRKQLDEASVAYVQARSAHEVAARHLEALMQSGKEEQVKAARAQLDAARGREQETEANLAYSRITSPIDGVIAERPLYPGEMSGPGAPLLTVMDVSKIVARSSVTVDQLQYVKAGNSAVITSADLAGELPGTVTVVSPALDPNSTTAEVWVLAPNPGERLRPGTSVRVAILAETVTDAVVIPPAALLPAGDGAESVLVAGPDGLAHERRVRTGIREEGKVQVLEGLAPGEQVIIVGGFGLQDKTRVRIENSETHE